MGSKHKINWWEADRPLAGLETDSEHEVEIQREAIPIIFVPGIMGSRLRRAEGAPTANGEYPGDAQDGLPLMRWDPGKPKQGWMAKNYLYRYAARRKSMLIGPGAFDPDYLTVADAEPVGDGFLGIMDDYRPFLEQLRTHAWGAIGRLFEFPVYAFGYNWSASAELAGRKLAKRIKEIKEEARQTVGACEKVILITHSMGGLVARAACKLAGAEGDVLGVVHGVQPATGAAAAYWRIKAGFEGDKLPSAVLGNDGKDVTAVLGNCPGGLQLLPNRHYRTNDGGVAWLQVTKDGAVYEGLSLPKSDPYEEIYRVKAVVEPQGKQEPSGNAYWGLVDPDLLAPNESAAPAGGGGGSIDDATEAGVKTPWERYAGGGGYLDIAKSFHDRLALQQHARTFCFAGEGQTTSDRVELKVEWRLNNVKGIYRTRGFSAEFVDADGWDRKAILQDPAGKGDGTVPLSSAQSLNRKGRPAPGDDAMPLKHQPAYENGAAQAYTLKAIKALCLMRYRDKRP